MTQNKWIICVWIILLSCCTSDSNFIFESYNLPEAATLNAEEVFRIETPDEGVFFSHIRKIHVLSDGNLVVHNYPDHQLYEISSNGDLLCVIGGQGRGPGEFIETFISFITLEDSLHVFDFNNSRHQVFARDELGGWHYTRESEFRRKAIEGLQEQVPEQILSSPEKETVGLFRIQPGSRDTLKAQYTYVSNVGLNIQHAGKLSRLRKTGDLAIHRGKNNSMSVHNNLRFYNVFYNYRPETDEVVLVDNTSNEIISIDSTEAETVIGYLPFERFMIGRKILNDSMSNVNFYYSGMEDIVREKILDHEPYYWNVILHGDRLWVNMARSAGDSPNWVITNLQGEILEAFHGPEKISEVTIHENRMYGSVKDSEGITYLVGYELNLQ